MLAAVRRRAAVEAATWRLRRETREAEAMMSMRKGHLKTNKFTTSMRKVMKSLIRNAQLSERDAEARMRRRSTLRLWLPGTRGSTATRGSGLGRALR